ncbi:MAG: helix-turn-helix domain-containing protein [Oscillospiraceae bacterium]|nr:helix-turn-helix domain-containing protein [Oscillospiraceae bacterium]
MRYEILKYERIRNFRVDKDLSQITVANELNIAQNTLSQYELGINNIPNEILIKLALFYETSTDYLLNLTDNPKPYKRKSGA